MRATVLFFGILRDLTGVGQDAIELPGPATVGQVWARYSARFPSLETMRASTLFARNHEFVNAAAPLADGDEIAFLPPVSGGCDTPVVWLLDGGNRFGVTRRPIDAAGLARSIQTGEEGALVTFEGTARNNTGGRTTRFLDYEGYEPMALKEMARIGAALRADYSIERVAMVHRLGRVMIGEASVAIVVSAAHRRPAFEAALEAIDRLKRTVPIWKKETFEDGSVWVEGERGHACNA